MVTFTTHMCNLFIYMIVTGSSCIFTIECITRSSWCFTVDLDLYYIVVCQVSHMIRLIAPIVGGGRGSDDSLREGV